MRILMEYKRRKIFEFRIEKWRNNRIWIKTIGKEVGMLKDLLPEMYISKKDNIENDN